MAPKNSTSILKKNKKLEKLRLKTAKKMFHETFKTHNPPLEKKNQKKTTKRRLEENWLEDSGYHK